MKLNRNRLGLKVETEPTLRDVRCPVCDKLICKASLGAKVEIKCPRCKIINKLQVR